MRFVGVCSRAHEPQRSYKPLSGEGAARRGRRFNPKGVPALYLAQTLLGAVAEANQKVAFKIRPCVLCAYEVDCEGVADLRDHSGCAGEDVRPEDLACALFADLTAAREPPSWALVRRLNAAGRAGALVPSFAPGAVDGDHNLVLWHWNDDPARRVTVHDPDQRLPSDRSSWCGT